MVPLLTMLDQLPDNQLRWVLSQLSRGELMQLYNEALRAKGFAGLGDFDFGRIIGSILGVAGGLIPGAGAILNPIANAFLPTPQPNFTLPPPIYGPPAPAPTSGFQITPALLGVGALLLFAIMGKR